VASRRTPKLLPIKLLNGRVWEEVLKRFPKIEVLEEPVRVRSSFVKGYEKLMVRIPS
jgi:hypothetical protein